MTRRTARRPRGTSTPTRLAGPVMVAVRLAACSDATGSPRLDRATQAPATAAVATPAPTAASTSEPTAKPTPEPCEFASTAYDSRATLPGGVRDIQALRAWDGQARIDSSGPYTDKVSLPDSILFFV